ncbi:MAG: hypothetical protein HZB65_01015 [Candidatus Aenigmarchaeota archaeon]|nr:hypothetical protein [Candidatus Aenigmarchaeota archaeon]
MTFNTLKPAGRLDPAVKRFLDPSYLSNDHNDYTTALTNVLENGNSPVFLTVKKGSKYSTELAVIDSYLEKILEYPKNTPADMDLVINACRKASMMYDSLRTRISQSNNQTYADNKLMEHSAKQPMNKVLYETTNPLLLILRGQ